MALFPTIPYASSISVATIMDPTYTMMSDMGYRIARARWPRPCRLFHLEYLGLPTWDMHVLRFFLQQHRLSVTPFEWHPTRESNQYDTAQIINTTPILINMNFGPSLVAHEWVTGQWVLLSDSTVPGLDNTYRIVVANNSQFFLENTIAAGSGTCQIRPFLPRAVGEFSEDTMPSAAKLIGPESTGSVRGRFNVSIDIKELL